LWFRSNVIATKKISLFDADCVFSVGLQSPSGVSYEASTALQYVNKLCGDGGGGGPTSPEKSAVTTKKEKNPHLRVGVGSASAMVITHGASGGE
jgi:hypothetical protein